MSRRLEPGKLVIASHNPGKVREIADLPGPHGVEPVSAADLPFPEPAETANPSSDNGDLKARMAAAPPGPPPPAAERAPALPAFTGRPGIYSARRPGAGPAFRVPRERH